LQEKVERIQAGSLKRLMIFLPPRHGKSEMVTVRYPAFFLENDPTKRVIVGTYNQTLANKFSRKCRRITEERIPLNRERKAVEDWETDQFGGFRAVGVGAGVTGQGGDLIIIDDPIKNREEANSVVQRENVWDWYTESLYTRLEPNSCMILIMTRWHEDDLAGRILASEDAPNWEVVNLPALAEANDALGREIGKALCPERYNEIELEKIKRVLGNSFYALYQQRPTAEDGEIFKKEWWQYYTFYPLFTHIIQSWDTAFKDKKQNDYSVCTTWGVAHNGYYLINRWKGKVLFPELKNIAKTLHAQYQPTEVLVEDKASGQSLIQELRRDTAIPIIPISVDTDKIARANSCTAQIEGGNVYLPSDTIENWVPDYLYNMSAFPNASHDDDVDSTSQFLNYMAHKQRLQYTSA
jgi:predicted phage terminase large subunit-like protein